MISFGGTSDPCAYGTLVSIQKLGSMNKQYSKAIMEGLEKLGIPSNRIFIHFQETEPSYVGFNKTTFAN